MLRTRLAAHTLTLMLTVALVPACTIAHIDGAGPQAEGVYADRLDPVDPNTILEWKRELLSDREAETSAGVGAAEGYTLTADAGFPWPVLLGESNYDIHYQPRGVESQREFWAFADATGLFAPFIYMSWDARLLDVETGRCVGSNQYFGITPLLAWSESTGTPGMGSGLAEDVVDGSRPLDSLKYDGESAFDLGTGILGFGTRNDVPFIKLLWIQIPLGD